MKQTISGTSELEGSWVSPLNTNWEKKLIVFDLYGTCMSCDGNIHPFRNLLKRMGITDRQDSFDYIIKSLEENISAEDFIKYVAQHSSLSFSDQQFAEFLATFTQDLQRSVDSTKLFDDTLHTISELKKRGYATALLSNLALPYVEPAKERLGGFFDYQIFSCLEGMRKPERPIFDKVLKESGKGKGDAVMIGNSATDQKGALAAGMNFVRINRYIPWIKVREHHVSIGCLTDLLELFK